MGLSIIVLSLLLALAIVLVARKPAERKTDLTAQIVRDKVIDEDVLEEDSHI